MAYYYNEYSSNKNMKNNHSDRFKYLKKLTQILLPLSLFSFLLSHHSSLSLLFIQFYDYLASNFSFKFKLFTYTTERNCIFLLCNGILVLIVQSSGLITAAKPAPKTSENARFEESKKKGAGKVEILEENISENVEAVEEDFQSFVDDDYEEEDDDDDGGIDTEELKKKCEDFIKKVKLEIQGA